MADDSKTEAQESVDETLETVDPGSADYPHRVELANYVTPSEIHVHLWASLSESGLVIEGQDFGAMVERIFGDTDYEYWVTVDWTHVAKVRDLLAEELGRTDKSVLDLLRIAWEQDKFKTDSDFRTWLDGHGIESRFSSY